ncbi:MAG: class F sortase [bacterium]|nr:class F sortase [bacterium]
MKTIIGGIALSLIIISFLFTIFSSPTQDSYIKPALAASSQPPQYLADGQDSQTDSGLSASFATPVLSEFQQSGSELEQSGSELEQSQPANQPIRLKIPKINIDAAVEYVGLTSQGAMDVPKDSSDVAWFELGARPGDNGSAVITGHYGRWKNGKGSVFDDLNKLSEGDRLYIEDEKGATITFVVREKRRYYPDADAKDVFSSNDGKSHLNLITCDGVWDKAAKSYSKRLIVFTDKE